MNHYIIPFFIPELACPNRCIYCNQHCISGQTSIPSPDEMDPLIQKYLATMRGGFRHVEIGFFGGNFTGIPKIHQQAFLKNAHAWLTKGSIQGIRISTRPDYINQEAIKLLQKYGVSCIELGVQSLDPEVLSLTGRGHTAEDSIRAARLIRNSGIGLGMQMMIGLPGDNMEKSMDTARQIAELGADNTRIYPTLVIRGTVLETLFNNGSYNPLGLDDAIGWSARLVRYFEENNVKVLRKGLHPSKELLNKEALVAGPFHPSFGEMVMSRMWKEDLSPLCELHPRQALHIYVAKRQLNAAIGHQASNRRMLENRHKKVIFKSDQLLQGRDYYVDDH